MKKLLVIFPALVCQLVALQQLQAADRYWIHPAIYQNFFSTPSEISDWQLIEDNGTGGFASSGHGSAILTMDNAAGSYANRLFNVNGASGRLLPFDVVNGRVELLVKAITGGNQRIFLQAQEFNSTGGYLGQVNILPARSATGYFSVNLNTITWDPATQQVRFIIGGENYSGQQGTAEFAYFSYSNTNNNWNNPANWSATSGGPGGATVPGVSDNAIFNGAGNTNGSCLLDIDVAVNSLQTTGSYSGNIDLQTHQLTVGTGGVSLAGGGITGSNQDLVINGDVVFNGGAFKNPSGSTYVSGNITINNGVLDFSAGTVIFTGSSDQQLISSVITPVNNLIINKPSGALTLYAPLKVSGTLTLTQGIVNTNGNLLQLGTSVSNTGTLVAGTGKVNGSFARWIAASATGARFFPLGNAIASAPLTLTMNSSPTAGGLVTAGYNDASPGFTATSFSDGALTVIGRSAANWSLQASGLSGGSYTLSVSDDHLGTITDLLGLDLTLAAGVVGSYQTTTGTLLNPLLNRSGLTVSNLTNTFYASVTAVALPVSWLGFNVSQRNGNVNWDWTLAMEDNVAFYTPQYSVDGIHFSPAGHLNPTNTGHSYHFDTTLSLSGTLFFRVEGTDKDGGSYYSITRVLNLSPGGKLSFYPVPAKDQVHLQWPYSDASFVQIVIIDGKGAVVHKTQVSFSPVMTIPLPILTAGIYYVYGTDSRQRRSAPLPLVITAH